jgi:hypothetical protein
MIDYIVLFVIFIVCYIVCRIKIEDFLNNINIFLIMGIVLFLVGCSIISIFYGIDVLRKNLLLGEFSHLRTMILPGYISFAVAILGLIEKVFRKIRGGRYGRP